MIPNSTIQNINVYTNDIAFNKVQNESQTRVANQQDGYQQQNIKTRSIALFDDIDATVVDATKLETNFIALSSELDQVIQDLATNDEDITTAILAKYSNIVLTKPRFLYTKDGIEYRNINFFCLACISGNTKLLNALLDTKMININERFYEKRPDADRLNRFTGITNATIYYNFEVVKILLSANADINIKERGVVTDFIHLSFCKTDIKDVYKMQKLFCEYRNTNNNLLPKDIMFMLQNNYLKKGVAAYYIEATETTRELAVFFLEANQEGQSAKVLEYMTSKTIITLLLNNINHLITTKERFLRIVIWHLSGMIDIKNKNPNMSDEKLLKQSLLVASLACILISLKVFIKTHQNTITQALPTIQDFLMRIIQRLFLNV